MLSQCRIIFRTTPAHRHRAAVGPQGAAGFGVNLILRGQLSRLTTPTVPWGLDMFGNIQGKSKEPWNKLSPPKSRPRHFLHYWKPFFFFFMLWALLQNVLINYCQIFSIFLISRTWGQQFQTNNKSSCMFRKSHFQSKFLRTLEYSQWKNIF